MFTNTTVVSSREVEVSKTQFRVAYDVLQHSMFLQMNFTLTWWRRVFFNEDVLISFHGASHSRRLRVM